MGKLLRSYFSWTYERGSIHFDIMVTLILIFLFVSPHYINFKDRPVETVALHGSEVLVKEAGHIGTSSIFVYQIRSDQAGGPTASQSQDDRGAEGQLSVCNCLEPAEPAGHCAHHP